MQTVSAASGTVVLATPLVMAGYMAVGLQPLSKSVAKWATPKDLQGWGRSMPQDGWMCLPSSRPWRRILRRTTTWNTKLGTSTMACRQGPMPWWIVGGWGRQMNCPRWVCKSTPTTEMS